LITQENCNPDCPVARASDVLSGKWTTLIIRDLLTEKKRFSELARSLGGISPRVLSERLSMLQGEGLISKKIYATVPPMTEYQLTPKGQGIRPVIEAMAEFGSGLLVRR